jgi:protein TonB
MNNSQYLEIIFEGRNKEYGAYELRKNYSNRLNASLFTVLFIVSGIFLFSFSRERVQAPTSRIITTSEVTLQKIVVPEEKQAQKRQEQLPKIKTVKYTAPVIVEDKKVQETVPDETEIEESKISTETQEGEKTQVVTVVNHPKGEDSTGFKIDADEDAVFEKVEIEANFPGGIEKWRRYLERNCNAQIAVDKGAPTGNYVVSIQFVVDTVGNISDIKPLTDHGYGMEEEAVRIIQRGPKWNPAIQNKNKVKSYKRQLITFQVIQE